jgi:hypothetical protein
MKPHDIAIAIMKKKSAKDDDEEGDDTLETAASNIIAAQKDGDPKGYAEALKEFIHLSNS